MESPDTAQAAALVGALGAVLALLAGSRLVLLAGFVLLAAAELGLAIGSLGLDGFDRLTAPAAVAGGAVGAIALASGTAVLVRWPAVVTPLVLAAAPFRLPLDVDTSNRLLFDVAESGELGRLLPLYAVLAAASLALVVRTVLGEQPAVLPRVVAVPAAALTAYAAVSLLWSRDLEAGANTLAFFLLPFVALVAVVGRAPFRSWLPKVLAIIAVALAGLFAVIGIWQAATKELLFFAPNLEVANTYAPIFRVTSLFRDPSLYGRHVVLGIAVLVVVLLLGRINLALAAALIAVLFAGLYFSYSQSSFVALFVVVLAIAAAAGDSRVRLAAAGVAALLVLAGAAIVINEVAGHVAAPGDQRPLAPRRADRARAGRPPADGGRPRRPAARQPAAVRALRAEAELRLALDAADRGRGAGGDRDRPLRRPPRRGDGDDRLRLAARSCARPRARRVAARPLRALPLLQRLLRGPDHLVRARAGLELPGGPADGGRTRCDDGTAPRSGGRTMTRDGDHEQLSGAGLWALLGTLGVLVAVVMPELGTDGWPFRPTEVDPRGILGPLVRAADEEWDLGILRSAAVLAGLLVAAAATVALRVPRWPRWAATTLAAAVVALLLVPATLLQVGLRDATEPWYFTNDSTYQIELAGDLILDGDNPYGHDYSTSGLERWYPAAGEGGRVQVALQHLAYFPGTTLTAAAWRLVPAPFDDYRVFVLLTTLAAFGAVLLFRAPFAWRLPIAAALAASPLAIKASWFGTADAPSLLCLLLAFALVTRSRYVAAAALLGAAILLKQFAVVALPFVAAMLIVRRVPRPTLWRAALACGGVVARGRPSFPRGRPRRPLGRHDRLRRRHLSHHRLRPRGLAAPGRGGSRTASIRTRSRGSQCCVWLPVTAYLVWCQLRTRALWVGAAGFTVSMFLLLFLGRVFQNSYLVWPLTGIAVTVLLAVTDGRREEAGGG